MFSQFTAEEFVATRLRQYNYVKVADYSLMETKTLPKLSLDEISLNGVFYIFFGDGHAQTGVTEVVANSKHRQVLATNSTGLAKYLLEFSRFQQPQLFTKAPAKQWLTGTTGCLLQLSAIRLRGGHGPWRGAP